MAGKWMMTASTLEHCIHIAKQDEPSSLLLMASDVVIVIVVVVVEAEQMKLHARRTMGYLAGQKSFLKLEQILK